MDWTRTSVGAGFLGWPDRPTMDNGHPDAGLTRRGSGGTLRLKTKGGRRKAFPVSEEIGEAIADYLRHGRPPCQSRRVFLRARAPIEEVRSSSISSLVRRAIERADVDAPTGGAHQFRLGLATEMLNGGASLGEIGDVPGHSHPDTIDRIPHGRGCAGVIERLTRCRRSVAALPGPGPVLGLLRELERRLESTRTGTVGVLGGF